MWPAERGRGGKAKGSGGAARRRLPVPKRRGGWCRHERAIDAEPEGEEKRGRSHQGGRRGRREKREGWGGDDQHGGSIGKREKREGGGHDDQH